ncbi:uncharacterized protein LAESUDRAFT_54914 [Laetiporus sulphureus 93-53]|uniref:Uncharacterized protein n=1 Tax=Laetiporus sulphureus 93-53 TaxID=1314785 RepID=A0A165FCQ0_9APHY|nr:uncharacterized protein LAESUDRAFT_54914 [Laetiporus sulphureus 93-53]KZT08770.1 hypothetical protein LAESUDRAFT_54914 [Laetiporus sulphureus 93-53]
MTGEFSSCAVIAFNHRFARRRCGVSLQRDAGGSDGVLIVTGQGRPHGHRGWSRIVRLVARFVAQVSFRGVRSTLDASSTAPSLASRDVHCRRVVDWTDVRLEVCTCSEILDARTARARRQAVSFLGLRGPWRQNSAGSKDRLNAIGASAAGKGRVA